MVQCRGSHSQPRNAFRTDVPTVPGRPAAGPSYGGAPCSCAARGIERGVVLVTAAAQTGTAARPVALFVLGMPRSGTSALTRVLSLCGGTLPAGMMGADSANPRGYWEPRKALHLNDSNPVPPRQRRVRPVTAPAGGRCVRRRREGRLHRRDRGVSHHAAGRAARGHQGPQDNAAVRRVVRGGASGRTRRRGRDCGAPPAGGHRVGCGGAFEPRRSSRVLCG